MSGEQFFGSGEIHEFPGDEAKRLIESGIAEAVKESLETATPQPLETAIAPEPRKRK